MLTADFPDIKAQFELELSAPLKHEHRSTCLIGGLSDLIFCLAVFPPGGCLLCIRSDPHSPLSTGGSSCLAEICLLLGMFRKAAQTLSLLGLMVCVHWLPCSVMFQSGVLITQRCVNIKEAHVSQLGKGINAKMLF